MSDRPASMNVRRTPVPRERFTDCERERPDGARRRDPAQRKLPDSVVIALDRCDEFPEELVRLMCGEELDVQLSAALAPIRAAIGS
jgi:hypothetical protein